MTNSNQKERFQTKIAMLEQNNQVLRNKCEEYLGELICTRKALDVAVQGIKKLGEYDPYKDPQSIYTIAQDIIEQITALEQKDVK